MEWDSNFFDVPDDFNTNEDDSGESDDEKEAAV